MKMNDVKKDAEKQRKEEREPAVLRIFLWNGLVDNVKSSDPNLKINVEIFNCDEDHDDQEKYEKMYHAKGLKSIPFSLRSDECVYSD